MKIPYIPFSNINYFFLLLRHSGLGICTIYTLCQKPSVYRHFQTLWSFCQSTPHCTDLHLFSVHEVRFQTNSTNQHALLGTLTRDATVLQLCIKLGFVPDELSDAVTVRPIRVIQFSGFFCEGITKLTAFIHEMRHPVVLCLVVINSLSERHLVASGGNRQRSPSRRLQLPRKESRARRF